MRELRSLFHDPEQFVERFLGQQKQGYQLAFLESEDEVCAVAGDRFLESLFSGKFVYVDGLVARESDRSRGSGDRLLDWLIEPARARLRKRRARLRRAGVRRPSVLFCQTNEHFILPLSD